MRSGDTLYVGSSGLTVAEVNEILHEGLDVGSLCSSSNINKFAKWKPFRMNATSFGTSSDQFQAMKNVHMGFNIPTAGVNSRSISNTEWTYELPRGLSNSEWYRLLDFAPLGSTQSTPGYCHDAVCPVATWWLDSVNNKANLYSILMADIETNVDSSDWNSVESVSLFDCLTGSVNQSDDYGSYLFALLIVDNNSASRALISSGVTVNALKSAQNKIIQLHFCSEYATSAVTEDNNVLPTGMFADSQIGHTYDFAWVIAPSSAFSNGNVNDLSTVPTMYSLNIDNDVNYANLELVRANTIQGLVGNITGELTAIIQSNAAVTDTYQGITYQLFRLDSLSVYLNTANTTWQIVAQDGTITDRTSVIIEVGTIGVLGNSYIMTSSTSLTDYSTIKPSYVDPGQSGNRSYEPTASNCLFNVAKGKTPATATVALTSSNKVNTGSGSDMPYIYVWLRQDQMSISGVQLNGSAFSDRTYQDPPYEGDGEEIQFTAENIYVE